MWDFLQNLSDDHADAASGQANRAGGTGGKVENPATDERATVIDGDNNAAAGMGDADARAERQAAVGGRQGFLIEALTRRGAPA